MRNSLLVRLLIVIAVYIGLEYFGGDIGKKILYPIHLLVTFLHELGHALGAVLTGGKVLSIEIDPDTSGRTRSAGGWFGVILMGGYIGSALLGNIIFYIGARKQKWAEATIAVLCAAMVFSGIYWYSDGFTLGFLVAFALGLYAFSRFTNFEQEILMFLGLASILYIIQDFRVGPSSDLEAYAKHMVILPKVAWMYIWLGIAILLCLLNLRMIIKNGAKNPNQA